MNTWSTYFLCSGLFTGFRLQISAASLEVNVPEDCGCIVGEYDSLAERVDIDSGLVIEYRPDQPSEDYAWCTESRRWLYVQTDADIARDARVRRARLLAESDWVSLRALDLAEGVPPEWSIYRSALRDVSMQPGFPRSITWPTVPTE
jgi:hypothetical protein